MYTGWSPKPNVPIWKPTARDPPPIGTAKPTQLSRVSATYDIVEAITPARGSCARPAGLKYMAETSVASAAYDGPSAMPRPVGAMSRNSAAVVP